MQDDLLQKLDFQSLKQLEMPTAERMLIVNILVMAERLAMEVLYCEQLGLIMLETQHGVRSPAIARDIVNLTCMKDMLRFIADEAAVQARPQKATASPQLELGSPEWEKDLRSRAKLIGNTFSEWTETEIIYYRAASPKRSPFVVGNAYRPSQKRSQGTKWIFSDKKALTATDYELIQKFVEHDERLYQAWLNAGKPQFSGEKIALLD